MGKPSINIPATIFLLNHSFTVISLRPCLLLVLSKLSPRTVLLETQETFKLCYADLCRIPVSSQDTGSQISLHSPSELGHRAQVAGHRAQGIGHRAFLLAAYTTSTLRCVRLRPSEPSRCQYGLTTIIARSVTRGAEGSGQSR